MYAKHNFDAESFYVGTMIRELCKARDNCNSCPQFFERSELLRMIYKNFPFPFFYCILLQISNSIY